MKRLVLPITIVIGLMVGCNSQSIELDEGSKEPKEGINASKELDEGKLTFKAENLKPVFLVTELEDTAIDSMLGVSLPNKEYANNLSSLIITYLDFTGTTQYGTMVVNKEVHQEVLDIFKEVYNAGYRIETMDVIEKYGGDDNKSMLANNSSAFNYRTIAGTDILSNHAEGYAIDINPFMNPHVIKGIANPKESQMYVDRNNHETGMIKEGDALYEAFTSRGWKWGGHWDNPDYQHFEKGK